MDTARIKVVIDKLSTINKAIIAIFSVSKKPKTDQMKQCIEDSVTDLKLTTLQ